MKTKIMIMALLAVALGGCSDFLEEKSQDEIRPSTVRDMEKLLEGEAYFDGSEGIIFNRGTDIFTDDVQCNALPDASQTLANLKEEDRWRFIWDRAMFNEDGGGQDVSFWEQPYERINRCNLILEYIDGMEGDMEKREHLKGEAYVLRGFYYLMLVNFFGMPYNFEDPAQHLGVPLKLDSGVTDDRLPRNNVAACYEQIEQDLLRGSELMARHASEQSLKLTRLNYLAGYALLSRMYLYMENWDKALAYADSVLAVRPGLLDLTSTTTGMVYSSDTPVEILWACLDGYTERATSMLYPYTPSEELALLYTQDAGDELDIRGDYNRVEGSWSGTSTLAPVFLKRGNIPYTGETWVAFVNKGTSPVTDNSYSGGVRTAEMYLNRAEALIHRYLSNGDMEDGEAALEALNTLRRHRFEAGYTDKQLSDFADGEALLGFCLRERRRELCAEGNHRWFDLRRQGMPSVTHVFVDDTGYETTYTLQECDSRYALPIPEDVIRKNTSLVQN